MVFIAGFMVWMGIALIGGFIAWTLFRAPINTKAMNYVFAIFGAFIGGMLGVWPYIFHAPTPLRLGGIIGAGVGALLFPWIYHIVARKFV
ncbi:MAG: hypothetical protein ACRELD_15110 [Longimicrobiales bacterium]